MVSQARAASGFPRVARTFQRQRFEAARQRLAACESPGWAFNTFLSQALHPGDQVVDVGTGEGRVALAAARLARRVVGIDSDEGALQVARARARSLGLAHVEFQPADLEESGLRGRDLRRRFGCPLGFDLALAHLCVSDPILRRIASLLKPDGRAVITALHSDHWYETGRGSRFAYDEKGFLRALRAARLLPMKVEIETIELTFPSLESVRDLYLGGRGSGRLRSWREDGRWARLEARFRAGRRTLTTSRITALARRRPPLIPVPPSR